MLHMTNTFHQKVKRAAFSVGFGEHCGDAMTHKLLDKIAQKNIYRSAVRPLTKSNPSHSNRILTWLTPNPPGVWPQNTPTRWFEGGDKLGAQWVGFEQATTINTLKIGENT